MPLLEDGVYLIIVYLGERFHLIRGSLRNDIAGEWFHLIMGSLRNDTAGEWVHLIRQPRVKFGVYLGLTFDCAVFLIYMTHVFR